MKLLLERKWKKDTYTIGNLYIDGKWFCNTVEDKDRGLKKSTPLNEIKAKKVYAETAIPTGLYKVTLNVVSNRFKDSAFYIKAAKGSRIPRLLNVPGFEGILIHAGGIKTGTAANSAGCIIVGFNKIKGGVTETREVFEELYKKLLGVKEIEIEIK